MIIARKTPSFKKPEVPSPAQNIGKLSWARKRQVAATLASLNSPDSQRKRRFETDSESEADSWYSKKRARYDQACNN